MKRLIIFIVCLVLSGQFSQAVLKEVDLLRTLEVLKDELTHAYKDQQVLIARYHQFDEMQHQRVLELIQRSNQTALVLYSQKQDYVFNLTYACNEATKQYQQFLKQQKPYYNILSKIEVEIARYERLIEALKDLPPRMSDDAIVCDDHSHMHSHGDEDHDDDDLDTLGIALSRTSIIDSVLVNSSSKRTMFALSADKQAERDTCVHIAISIRDVYRAICEEIKGDMELYTATAEKLKKLNDYADERYKEIQKNIFVNGDASFISMCARPQTYVMMALRDMKEKYVLTGEETARSAWKGPRVIGFAFIVLFYLVVAVVICNLVMRFAMRKKKHDTKFQLRKNYYIMTASLVLFSIVLLVLRTIVQDNFFRMASFLLVEFALLVAVVIGSLLFRYIPSRLYSGFKIYMPVMVMGFIVILCRIIFVPNSVVSVLFPPILLVMVIWQYRVAYHNNKIIPRSDRFYSWISFASILFSCVASWCGFTLLAVQVFIWWMMQLTCIQGITCCVDAMKIYEDRILMMRFDNEFGNDEATKKLAIESYHKRNGDFFIQTWLADLVNMTVIPLLSVFTLPLCIYYSADMFDMSDAIIDIFYYPFVDVKDIIQLSIYKIVVVFASFYLFRFINYSISSSLRHVLLSNKSVSNQGNIALSNNLTSLFCWGIYFIFTLIWINVPASGIAIVTTGLATGIGFAMKDIINNFFYGLSLMTGQVRVGEYIECDGIRGRVEGISVLSTQVQTIDGSIIAFPNSNLFSKSFKNMTRNHDYELVKLPVCVAYGTDINNLRQVLVERIRQGIVADPDGQNPIDSSKGVSVIFNNFGESGINLYVVLWVRVLTKLKTCGDVNEVIYNVLNENNIRIPYPQCDIHMEKPAL